MLEEQTNEHIPSGFKLCYTLRGNSGRIKRVAWSPDGHILASPGGGKTISLWNTQTGKTLRVFKGHTGAVYSVAWSPNGALLASGSNDQSIQIWEVQSGNNIRTIRSHLNRVTSLAWSPDGALLASGSFDKTIFLWNVQTGERLRTLTGHFSSITSVAWSPDGQLLASSSGDQTIKLWNPSTGQLLQTLTGHNRSVRHVTWSPNGELLSSCSNDKTIRLWKVDTTTGLPLEVSILEGHTRGVTCTSFSYNNHFLASKSDDGTVRLWRISTLETSAILDETTVNSASTGLAFHPTASILATLGEEDQVVRIWDLDFRTLFSSTPIIPSVHYTNAKVVLVGDSGVGKSGLALVISGQQFAPTPSTHGRQVWILDKQETELGNGGIETREILLWDLAGQPGYRLTHQLYLNEVAVALILFDTHSETDPFAGVYYWERALRLAQRVHGNAFSLKKILVATRIDRGGRPVSRQRIDALIHELEFDDYFETSAQEGWNIGEITEAIKKAIDWEMLPRVSSNDLFLDIKDFLLIEKESGLLLSTVHDLYRLFLKSWSSLVDTEELRAQFETCIGLVESRGLIWRLSFGNLVLLQPERLDAYASALVNAVKEEPDGLGSIAEAKIRMADFHLPENLRLEDREQEKLLLIAMVEDLLRHEIALREPADDGPYIIFPSQSTRENPDLPDPEQRAAIFEFKGPILNIYATLAVRLSHSNLFKLKELWKNAVTYNAQFGGVCGIFLSRLEEGRGALTLFFDKNASEETRYHFEEYIYTHLQRRALPESIQRRAIFTCIECGNIFTDWQVVQRRARGFTTIHCSVCDSVVSLLTREERLITLDASFVYEIDEAADTRRERDVANSVLQGKRETNDFDVFLCYCKENKAAMRKVGEQLKDVGILPWLDEWELRPGLPWQRALEQQIERIKTAAVFVGKKGVGPWQMLELEAFLRQFVKRGCPVIPVLLPGVPKKPQLPIFLEGLTWIDFRKRDPDPIAQLIWGITGDRSKGS